MKFFTTFFLIFLAATCVTAVPQSKKVLPTTSRLPQSLIDELKAAAEGCNGNVCFAIDGSGSISGPEFDAQVELVQDIISIIADGSNPVKTAACQYGPTALNISPLSINPVPVIGALEETEQIGGRTFVTAGINFCFAQLFGQEGDANKIVLLGDGFDNIGRSPAEQADLFRYSVEGGLVCTVASGDSNDEATLLAISGGNPALVFDRVDFLDAISIQQLVKDLVNMICSS